MWGKQWGRDTVPRGSVLRGWGSLQGVEQMLPLVSLSDLPGVEEGEGETGKCSSPFPTAEQEM